MEYSVTERGHKMLIKDGYRYIQERQMEFKTIWKCQQWYKNKCKGRLHVYQDEILKSTCHNHVPDAAKIQVCKSIADLKERACTTASGTRSIIADTIVGIPEAAIGDMPMIKSMKRTVQRCRNQVQSHPSNPRTLADFHPAAPYTETCDGLKFLLKDTGHSSQDRMLIFGTENSLDLLVSSRHWFGDGTFKTVPSLFGQLYTIHVMKYGEVFPALYILMCRKKEDTYSEMLREIKSLRPGLNPAYFLIDFEKAAISAFRKEFSHALVKGCFFHFTQSIYRKVQEVGLQSKYADDPEFAVRVRMLNALAFVPVNDVITKFEELQETEYYKDHEEELSPLINYFEDVWIGRIDRRGQRKQPTFAHEMWNHFDSVNDEMAKTNNSVEGWHTSFSSLIGGHHVTIFKFIEGLKKDEILTRQRIKELDCGNQANTSKKCYRDTSKRIKRIVSEYSTRPLENYLRAIALNFQLQV